VSNGDGRPIPLLGDISLERVQRIEHVLDGGFASMPIAGLDGELQQRSGRPSHRIRIAGVLLGEDAGSQLETLQQASAAGDELTFASDITTALELQNVVITSFNAVEVAGHPQRVDYEVSLAESPPLPPPAQLEAFGGLDEFGLGDLGFDTDLLDELGGLADELSAAADAALGLVDQLASLAVLAGDLPDVGGFLDPITRSADGTTDIAGRFKGGLSGTFG
jgi:hypothetical protein